MTTDKPELDLDRLEEYVRREMTPTSGSYIRDADALALIEAARERDVLAGRVERVREVADDWDCHPNAESMHDALIQALSAGGGAE